MTVDRCPSGVCSANDSTWLAKLPSTWWFLPCTSAAIAPPTVTRRVPGVTGTNQPSGTSVRMSASRLTPASTRTTPVLEVDVVDAGERGGVEHGAAGVLRRVAVAAAEPARDERRAARHARAAVDVAPWSAASTTVGRGRRGAAPAGEELDRAPAAAVSHGHAERERHQPQRRRAPAARGRDSTTSSGAPPPPWSIDERVAQHRDDERHDRQPEPGVVAGVRWRSRTPTGSTR